MGRGDDGMKLTDVYTHTNCPSRSSAYYCDGPHCTKFISCMMDEIDALHAIGGINNVEVDDLDRELIQLVKDAHNNR